jgi:hypothetical protein
MQTIETPRSQKSGYRIRAPFDQNPAKAPFSQCASDCGGRKLATVVRERHDLDPRQVRRWPGTGGNHDAAIAIVPQRSRRRGQASLGVNDDAGGVWSHYAAHGQLRIISSCRSDANDDCVDQCPQPVEMIEPRVAIDVVGVTGRRGNAPVDGLPALPDQNEVIDRTFAQRAEQVFPRLLQRRSCLPKYFGNPRPWAPFELRCRCHLSS